MNLLFWNLHKKANENILKTLLIEKSIDIAIFSEYVPTRFDDIITDLLGEFCLYEGNGACNKVLLIARKNIRIIVIREQDHYTFYDCTLDKHSFLIVGVHLPAFPSNYEERKSIIRDLVSFIREQELKQKHSNTIVIGDFNASPFDEELIQTDVFNAVLFRNLIMDNEYVEFNRKRYRRFYNPTINYIMENRSNYGSYYYSKGVKSLYWYCYDQVLVRKALANMISDICYCKSIKGQSLLKRIAPNADISDHLPLIAQIETEG